MLDRLYIFMEAIIMGALTLQTFYSLVYYNHHECWLFSVLNNIHIVINIMQSMPLKYVDKICIIVLL